MESIIGSLLIYKCNIGSSFEFNNDYANFRDKKVYFCAEGIFVLKVINLKRLDEDVS